MSDDDDDDDNDDDGDDDIVFVLSSWGSKLNQQPKSHNSFPFTMSPRYHHKYPGIIILSLLSFHFFDSLFILIVCSYNETSSGVKNAMHSN